MIQKEISGQVLKKGDHVKMNIEVIGKGDLDGVEITNSGTNYWLYMQTHPDEVYTVEGFDFSVSDECIYVLSGAMSGNTWAADELILVQEPQTVFEVIKNMTIEEMADELIPLIQRFCEDGIPTKDSMLEILKSDPHHEQSKEE